MVQTSSIDAKTTDQTKSQNDDYDKRFSGMSRLIGNAPYNKLSQSHVMVIGVGGVGSWAVESLARSGIGKFTLVDLDDVCVSNINRQLPALDHTVGKEKAAVLKDRILSINPYVQVDCVVDFFTHDTADEILKANPDFVIDAIDNLTNKALLISECIKRDISLIVCGGAGGRTDPTAVRSADLMFTKRDKLLKTLRQKLKKHYGLGEVGKPLGVYGVYSEELPVYPTSSGEVCSKPEGHTFGLSCKSGMGSASFVTSVFGMAAASIIIREIRDSIYIH
jgi:tRNA threonylcarbamoyladenosine dehydratase